jgi:hypothetical protein
MTVNRWPSAGAGLLTAGLLALAGGTALFFVTAPRAAEPPPQPPAPEQPSSPPKKLTAEEYRQKYPFESLAERLAYEEGPAKELKNGGTAPALSADTLNRLDAADKPRAPLGQDMRRKTLEILHSDEAQKFIDREGFGVSRLPRPSLLYLELPPGPTIPFDKPGAAVNPDREPRETLRSGKAEGRMPSLDLLGSFHQLGGRDNFASPGSFGYVKDREHVAGFQSHQFRRMPNLGDFQARPKEGEAAKEKWLVTRLELVSLLRHKEPAVYVAAELPRMDTLNKGRLRPLADFEGRALAALRGGEEVVTEATTNHIRMLGALRASTQCLDCHQVRRGDLLGAFSYDLQRDPPLKTGE